MSQLFGNLYVFFAWQGKDEIDPTSRITLFSILVGFGSLGLIAFGFIKVRGRNKFFKVEISIITVSEKPGCQPLRKY